MRMGLRTQKTGKQKPWTREELADGLKHFHSQHKRYPTASEVDAYPYLPSARTIERSFGGVVELRRALHLEGQDDFRTGLHSTQRAEVINKRAHKTEQLVYDLLQKLFGKEFVHREYFFTDDKRTRADFFVYDKDGGICVDVFYPSDKRNLIGCLNSKLEKYQTSYMRQYPVIFLQMNQNIDQSVLDELVKRKRRPLMQGQFLMSWGTFQRYCSTKKRLLVK